MTLLLREKCAPEVEEKVMTSTLRDDAPQGYVWFASKPGDWLSVAVSGGPRLSQNRREQIEKARVKNTSDLPVLAYRISDAAPGAGLPVREEKSNVANIMQYLPPGTVVHIYVPGARKMAPGDPAPEPPSWACLTHPIFHGWICTKMPGVKPVKYLEHVEFYAKDKVKRRNMLALSRFVKKRFMMPRAFAPSVTSASAAAAAPVIRTTFKLAGKVEDYDEAARVSIVAALAAAAGVPSSAIRLTLTAGSVIVSAQIDAASADAAETTIAALSASILASPASLQTALTLQFEMDGHSTTGLSVEAITASPTVAYEAPSGAARTKKAVAITANGETSPQSGRSPGQNGHAPLALERTLSGRRRRSHGQKHPSRRHSPERHSKKKAAQDDNGGNAAASFDSSFITVSMVSNASSMKLNSQELQAVQRTVGGAVSPENESELLGIEGEDGTYDVDERLKAETTRALGGTSQLEQTLADSAKSRDSGQPGLCGPGDGNLLRMVTENLCVPPSSGPPR